VSTSRPLRLLAYTDSEAVGGAELALGYLLGALGERIEVGVLATSPAIAEKIASHRPGAVPISVKSPRGARDLGALLEHRAAIRAFAPDVLHCNQAWPWACAYGELAGVLDRRVRVLAVDHLPVSGAIPRARRLGRRLLARRLDVHVSVGEHAARRVEEIVGLPSNSVGSVPNGVPSGTRHEPRSGVDDGLGRRGAPVIGSVGRLTDQKGYDLLLRALPGLTPARLVLVGDGPRRPALEALAVELGVAERLQITGWVDDAPARLGDFDVFALPSRWEGMPLGILEAMHAGLPVVACDVGSVSEVVKEGQTGYVVQAEDVASLQNRLAELLADVALRERMGECARGLAKACFTDVLMARRYEAIYGSMVDWWQPEELLAIPG
jgi:glycosyltransferase involved in cell wall biosynthesis